MFVHQIIYLYQTLCIIVTYNFIVAGDNDFYDTFFANRLSTYDTFGKGARKSQEEKNPHRIDQTNNGGSENHKELAEDVLRHYMTAYFSSYEAGFHSQILSKIENNYISFYNIQMFSFLIFSIPISDVNL